TFRLVNLSDLGFVRSKVSPAKIGIMSRVHDTVQRRNARGRERLARRSSLPTRERKKSVRAGTSHCHNKDARENDQRLRPINRSLHRKLLRTLSLSIDSNFRSVGRLQLPIFLHLNGAKPWIRGQRASDVTFAGSGRQVASDKILRTGSDLTELFY